MHTQFQNIIDGERLVKRPRTNTAVAEEIVVPIVDSNNDIFVFVRVVRLMVSYTSSKSVHRSKVASFLAVDSPPQEAAAYIWNQ